MNFTLNAKERKQKNGRLEESEERRNKSSKNKFFFHTSAKNTDISLFPFFFLFLRSKLVVLRGEGEYHWVIFSSKAHNRILNMGGRSGRGQGNRV